MQPGERLLDLGTGTGGLLRRLAARAVRPREACGIDSSEQMLAQAPALPAGWELRQADAMALPFPDGSFDVATAAYLLHLLEPAERARVLAEARRVLAPGSRLVTVTTAGPRRLFALLAHLVPGLQVVDPRPDLEAAGFVVTGARRVLLGYPSLCVLAVTA